MAGKDSRLILSSYRRISGTLRNQINLHGAKSSTCLQNLRILNRGLSQLVAEREDEVSVGPKGPSSTVASDMPFMVPPQTIHKAYNVHQSPRFYALKPHEKMMWLTKTYLTVGMPKEIDNINQECTEDVLNLFKDIVHQGAAFQINPTRPSTTFHEEEYSLGLVQDFFRIVMCTGSPGSTNDLYIHTKPLTETNWFRNFNFFHAKYRPSLILRTSRPLPSFTADYPMPIDEFPTMMPGPFDTYALGTYETSIVKLKNSLGVNHSKYFSKPFVHTAVQVNTRMNNEEFFQSSAMMTAFTQLLAVAQEQGHKLGLPLKEPMNCNCIVTNGVSMLMMVYQLNTTELHDDRGIWNRAWCSPLMPLFTPNEGFPTKRQFHEISNRDKLENFNEDAFKLFYKLMKR